MTESIMHTADRVIAATYKRFPIVLQRGKGCSLWDTQGRRYTDFVAGIAVCNLGHAHPRIADAVARQARELVHVSNLYYTIPQTELARLLVENSFADRVFFGNSGAEANEAAIKLARKYAKDQGRPERYRIVCMEKSFHGRTMATLAATGQDKIRKGFDPVLQGFSFVPFNDIDALAAAIDDHTCAVLLEPIQGEGGIHPPAPNYLRQVRQLCDERGVLMILDEIQTGMGRTGKLFAHEHFGAVPDIMTLAKALANGLPIGAMLATETVAASFGAGAHASTFGGTPLVTAAALETLTILLEDKVIERAADTGDYFKNALKQLKQRHGCVIDVRGQGLLLGLQLDRPADELLPMLMEKGFLVNCVQGDTLRFAPPLIIEKNEIDALIRCLDELLTR
ncbi:acetylornithine aminotransferase [Desulfosarcina ovata subsp. sediminis]|uniref:Acetylornithine aminotransferase n=1 Tax=Desulfosarcina ovata subsp. sediminis TaxID=885957 RepID=A0A5K7ZHR7_9BACT|nr:acetylornithine transaminase [Desulfosarcina ovata]BBO81748.1 acetylornithine aminotransferase [Desulfosarcina ovata subsp. sediminis]